MRNAALEYFETTFEKRWKDERELRPVAEEFDPDLKKETVDQAHDGHMIIAQVVQSLIQSRETA